MKKCYCELLNHKREKKPTAGYVIFTIGSIVSRNQISGGMFQQLKVLNCLECQSSSVVSITMSIALGHTHHPVDNLSLWWYTKGKGRNTSKPQSSNLSLLMTQICWGIDWSCGHVPILGHSSSSNGSQPEKMTLGF